MSKATAGAFDVKLGERPAADSPLPPARTPKRIAGARWNDLLWLLPAVVLYAIGLLLPLGITVQHAFELGPSGWYDLALNPLFIHAALNTGIDSVEITVISVVLAYSLAAAIWRSGSITRTLLTAVIVIVFWTPVLVKIVAFNALLRDNGVLNAALHALGLIDKPLRLFPGRQAMIIAMVQFTMPFAIFPILGVMMRLDKRIEQAAQSLGARPWRIFVHVVLPLTLPGVIAASLLVFVICTGFYLIPAALGTPHDQLLANVVALYALQLVDFKTASAVAMVLVVVVALLTALNQRVERAIR